jgi:hypothetical protein
MMRSCNQQFVRCWIIGLALAHASAAAMVARAAEADADPLGAAVPKAAFVDDHAKGRDPFFPTSTRRTPVIAKVVAPKPALNVANRGAAHLTLRGITGPQHQRMALINNMTFVAGEEGAVRVPGGLPLRVRVLQVLEKSAIVIVEGENFRRELKLKDGS